MLLIKGKPHNQPQKMQAGLFFAEANPKLVASSIVAATLLGAGVMNLVDTKSLNADYIRERTSLLSRNESDTNYNTREIAKLQQNLKDFKEKHEGDFREQKKIKEELAVLTTGYMTAYQDLQKIKSKLWPKGGKGETSHRRHEKTKIYSGIYQDDHEFDDSSKSYDASELSFDPDTFDSEKARLASQQHNDASNLDEPLFSPPLHSKTPSPTYSNTSSSKSQWL